MKALNIWMEIRMSIPFRVPLKQATLAQRFMIASLLILIAGMAGIGVWIGNEIKNGVIHRTGATTALYVDSFVAPILQELGSTGTLSPEHHEQLDKLLQDTPMGQQIVTFRVWDPTGKVIYSTDAATRGKTFPIGDGLAQAILGQVSSEISQLEAAENAPQRSIRSELLETYSPVRLSGTNQVIAVAEFYQTVDALNHEIAAAQRRSWLVVLGATLLIYLLLAGFVQRASDTIEGQQSMLNDQISRLTELLAQNKELHDRVRRAAGSVATLNERFLRRIGSELHDGPAQDLGLVHGRQVREHEANGVGGIAVRADREAERPIRADHEPLRPEGVDRELDRMAQVVDRPCVPRGLADEARDRGAHVGLLRERQQRPTPAREVTRGDRWAREVIEHEAQLRQRTRGLGRCRQLAGPCAEVEREPGLGDRSKPATDVEANQPVGIGLGVDPVAQGHEALALLAFLGGLSAATGMVILSTLALSVMIGNHWLAPLLVRGAWAGGGKGADLRGAVLMQRRIGIVVVVLLAWGYSRAIAGRRTT